MPESERRCPASWIGILNGDVLGIHVAELDVSCHAHDLIANLGVGTRHGVTGSGRQPVRHALLRECSLVRTWNIMDPILLEFADVYPYAEPRAHTGDRKRHEPPFGWCPVFALERGITRMTLQQGHSIS